MRKGRFDEPASETAQLYSESVSVDWRLYSHDIKGSLAHAAALAAAGILSKEEHEQIKAALSVIEAEIEAGDFRRCQKPGPAAGRGLERKLLCVPGGVYLENCTGAVSGCGPDRINGRE